MKKIITLFLIFYSITFSLQAQIKDTVSMGAGYSNMVWYNLETDTETKFAANTWDIGISVRAFDAAVIVNANSVNTYYEPIDAIGNWANITKADTSKLTKPTYNDSKSWWVGAYNTTSTDKNVSDYGWGSYYQATKNVIGDSLFILKTVKGEYKKLALVSIRFDTMYVIKYANLDGTNEKMLEIKKADYPKKNFVYLSLSDDKVYNPEPDNDKWHLLFTKYHGIAPNPFNGKIENYTLTGVLQNNVLVNQRGMFANVGVTTAKVTRKELSKDDFDATKASPSISAIGADWKYFDMGTTPPKWTLSDSTTYFVRTKANSYYKINFTGFGAGTTGNFIFDKKALTFTTVKDVLNGTATFNIYPNPSNGNDLTLIYNLEKTVQKADFQLLSLTGQTIFSQKLQNTEGVQTVSLPTLNIPAGIYFAQLKWGNNVATEKVVIR